MTQSAIKVQAIFRGKKGRSEADIRFAEKVVETEQAEVKKDNNERLKRVNQFSIGKELGRGAYGQVYKGTSGSDTVAIKVMTRSILKRKRVGRNASAYDSVMREIAVMKRLRHGNCVQLFEVIDDADHDQIFLILEYISGGDLSECVKRKREVPEAELRTWLRDACVGLEYLHASGVCHRDIKPENIMWDARQKRAMLTDFGVSSLNESGGRAGDFLASSQGTYYFFAPEMCRATKGVGYSGRAADVWACGVTLYMWLYHAEPYTSDTPSNLLQLISSTEVPYPPLKGSRSAELIELLHTMLARAPAERFRLKDMRKDAFLTARGELSLPEPPRVGEQSVARAELQAALSKVVQFTAGVRASKGSANSTPSSSFCRSSAVSAESAAPTELSCSQGAEAVVVEESAKPLPHAVVAAVATADGDGAAAE